MVVCRQWNSGLRCHIVPSMETARIAILLTVLSVVAVAQEEQPDRNKASGGNQPESGTICVLPNSPDPPTRISPGGDHNPATLTVRIDKLEPILWPHKHPVRIENLALNERHLVVLTSDGKRIKSFWFRFSQYNEVKLCLYFDGYQGVDLEGKMSLWCKCK
jgi:hypothetical protein